MLKRQRPTAQGRRCKCTGCSESTACHEPRFPPASGAFEAASCFLSRVNPQLYSQALQRPTAQGRRCKCTGCSESTACHRPRFPPASGAFEAASCFLSRSGAFRAASCFLSPPNPNHVDLTKIPNLSTKNLLGLSLGA